MKRNIFNLAIMLFFAITLIVFGPSEIFISNKEDFLFSYTDLIPILVVVGVIFVVIGTVFLMIIPDKVSDVIALIVFGFTLGSYMQAMLLNGKMHSLTGDKITWTTWDKVENIVCWEILEAVIIGIWLWKKNQRDTVKKVIQFIAGALAAVQMVALVGLLLTTDTLSSDSGEGYVSTEGMLEVSNEDNVIIFIVDFTDGRIVQEFLEEQPDILSQFTGFTYFPTATSTYSRTYPSIVHILTGANCYFDREVTSWVDEAYDESDSYTALMENNVDIGLYTFPTYIGSRAKESIINWKEGKKKLDVYETVKYMAKMVLYRDMPYFMKERFGYAAEEVNNSVILTEDSEEDDRFRQFDDEWFESKLMETGISIKQTEKVFRFYHLASCHTNLSDPVQYGIRALNIVNNYCEQLKKLGVYKDATIIITADHGSSGSGETLDLPQKTAVPFMMVKPANQEIEPLVISDAPVSQLEIIPQVLAGFSIESGKEKNFFDIMEDEDRDRMYYYSALYSDEDGEIELREYKVSGDARLEESYSFTGNTWDILYSENKIKKEIQ